MLKSKEYSNCHEPLPRVDKWEIQNLQTLRYIKISTLPVAYLVKGLD